MTQLIYASTAEAKLCLDEVHDILNVSNKQNKLFSITGLLLWNNFMFLQCLEGNKADIEQLYQNIQKDKRHHTIKLLGQVEINRKDFEEWSMGFVNTQYLTQKMLSKHTGFSDFAPYHYTFNQARDLLKHLSRLI